MCYKQIRKYGIIFILVFFGTVFFVFNRLELNDDALPYENVQPDNIIGQPTIENQKTYCGVPIATIVNNSNYPECLVRLKWLHSGWRSHRCYAKYGVNGTDCSFYDYMTKREHYCPLPSSWPNDLKEYKENHVQMKSELNHLFSLMNDSEDNYDFIKTRITRLWPRWLSARDELLKTKPEVNDRHVKNIFLYLGFLNKDKNKLNFAKASKSGGPLGELVQWSDLIASLYALGHNLEIHTMWQSTKEVLQRYQKTKSPCPEDGEPSIDLIFIDIMGLQKVKKLLKSFYVENWCRFRVLDSFGTHAEFNQPQYFRSNYKKYGTKTKSNPWGGNALNLQQFLTLYPHTDDNTFLGFVVETHPLNDAIKRENITVVYAKEAYMWENSSSILEVAARYTKIHATVENYKTAAKHAHMDFENHGILNGIEFNNLLQRSKVFLGLGFPLEGPASLEAISNGAVFIQPKFDPPKDRLTYKFFSEKPTMRKITSQNPYLERFVGSPHVLTVDMNNPDELAKAYEKALQLNPEPTLPYEFSFLGMLERVDVIVTNLNFCSKQSNWPPFDKVGHVILGQNGESCQQACSTQGFLCERSFFKHINKEEQLKRYGCTRFENVAEPFAPSLCKLQTDPYLFSCATEPEKDIQRLCPCRTFKKHQTILCDIC